MEAHIGKYILGLYAENLKELNNATGEEDNNIIKPYLLITNLDQPKYSSLANRMPIQYSTKKINIQGFYIDSRHNNKLSAR